jgi:hypothetical protein
MKKQYNICLFCSFVFFSTVVLCYGAYRDKNNSIKNEKRKQTQALIRQIARWTVASQQDTSPMIALLHANYAAGYLQALELITTEKEINEFTNPQELRTKVYNTQDHAAQQVASSCPGYLGKDIDKDLALMGIHLTDEDAGSFSSSSTNHK